MRYCYRSPLIAATVAALLSVSDAASDRVLVLGAQQNLIRDTIPSSSSSFTSAGLALLAMNAYGLPAGSVVRLTSGGGSPQQIDVQSPAQANVFSPVDAYAMIYVDASDVSLLDTVAHTNANGYSKIFDLAQGNLDPTKIPAALATELKQLAGSQLLCAGSDAVCKPDVLPSLEPSATTSSYTFLDPSNPVERKFASQLAQVQKLVQTLSNSNAAPNAFFAVQFSAVNSLPEAKRGNAKGAITTEIASLLHALQAKYPTNSGAQIVASGSAHATAIQSSRVLNNVIAYSRMLLSFEDEFSGSDDSDDSEAGGNSTARNATKSDVTLEDIAEYQIVLWTSVLLGGVLILVVLVMCNMDTKRDSLLYAKFITSNNGRKFD